MNQKNQSTDQSMDDFDLALAAMERAANTARKRALLRDGRLVVWRDGHMVKESVNVNRRKP